MVVLFLLNFSLRVEILEAVNTNLFVTMSDLAIPVLGVNPVVSIGGKMVADSNCGTRMSVSPWAVAAQPLMNMNKDKASAICFKFRQQAFRCVRYALINKYVLVIMIRIKKIVTINTQRGITSFFFFLHMKDLEFHFSFSSKKYSPVKYLLYIVFI